MAHVSANVVQQGFQGYADDNAMGLATAKAGVNGNWTQTADQVFRVRLLAQENAGGDTNQNGSLEYSINGGGFAAVGATTPVQFATSAFVADGTATSQQIGAGTFAGGEFDSNGATSNVSINNTELEFEYGLLIDSAQVSNNDTVAVRISGLAAYNQTPSITASVPVPDALLANDVSSTSAVSVPALAEIDTSDDLLANDVSSASTVSVPAAGQEHVLTATDVSSASTVASVAVGQEHALAANDVASGSSVTAPALAEAAGTDPLLANDVSSASTVSSAALGQEHVLTNNGPQSLSTVSQPTLASESTEDTLLAENVSSGSTVASTALGQTHVLTGASLSSTSSVSTPALVELGGGTVALLAEDVSSVSTLSVPLQKRGKSIDFQPQLVIAANGDAKLYQSGNNWFSYA